MTRCRLLMLADEAGEAAGGEVLEVAAYFLEAGGRETLLQLVHRAEAQLGLAILRRLGPVEVGLEPGEVGPGEADLLLHRGHQRQVLGGIVRLELRRVLGRVVDDGRQRRTRRRALVAGL